MKFLDEYRDPELAQRLVEKIRNRAIRSLRLMEFCGGHTVAIMKYGLRRLLFPPVELLSGPGCPVCVTANVDIDKAIALAQKPEIILTTFGDMLKVPGSYSSLQKTRAEGGDIRIVYSAQDALEIAQGNPDKKVVFLGIGFETTAPTIAASILEAKSREIKNYYVLSLHKLCPPVIKALLDSGETRLDGIILPGHVSAIIGSYPYEFIPCDYGIGGVVAGFEPLDLLLAVEMLIAQIENQKPTIEIAYRRGVKTEGNKRAREIMEMVFDITEANWRGLGRVQASGLTLKREYQDFDAEASFVLEAAPAKEPEGCVCGEILRGIKTPLNCKLFGKQCTPEQPVGPCMVSSEGSCAAYYLYGGSNNGR
ncbi:MAG: hydrogenase formation protein HypD [Thermodesulfobacteriota bacterium]|nr:MAG: hydrogenase formation protein HypD [Thermodesulfobacteriota bacterium]